MSKENNVNIEFVTDNFMHNAHESWERHHDYVEVREEGIEFAYKNSLSNTFNHIEHLEQSLAEHKAFLGEALEAMVFMRNEINKYIKYKPSSSSQGRQYAISKVLLNDVDVIITKAKQLQKGVENES